MTMLEMSLKMIQIFSEFQPKEAIKRQKFKEKIKKHWASKFKCHLKIFTIPP